MVTGGGSDGVNIQIVSCRLLNLIKHMRLNGDLSVSIECERVNVYSVLRIGFEALEDNPLSHARSQIYALEPDKRKCSR